MARTEKPASSMRCRILPASRRFTASGLMMANVRWDIQRLYRAELVGRPVPLVDEATEISGQRLHHDVDLAPDRRWLGLRFEDVFKRVDEQRGIERHDRLRYCLRRWRL